MSDTVAFALVVVQHPDDEHFCLVHEKERRGWWLPGGGVDAGQTFAEAAVREAEEEAGVVCVLTGVLRVETHCPASGRLRVIFHARPVDASLPLKGKADHHSRGARWVTVAELDAIESGSPVPGVDPETCYLRGREPHDWFHYLARGGAVYPLAALEMLRHGSVAEWSGPGDPPRAVYGTTFGIAVACVRDGLVAVTSSGSLPTLAAPRRRPLHLSALDFARSIGGGGLMGVAHVRHILDVRSSDPGRHACHLEVTYAASWDAPAAPQGCSWIPIEGLGRRVVVAHNNAALRAFFEGLAAEGWICRFFEKTVVDEVVAALASLDGALLVCASNFPLDRLARGSRALVWSKAAASDPAERARLLSDGAAFVAWDADPTPDNLSALRAEIKRLSYPRLGPVQAFSMIDDEGVPPTAA